LALVYPKLSKEVVRKLLQQFDPSKLADSIGANMHIPTEHKQSLLAKVNVRERLKTTLVIMNGEIEIGKIRHNIQEEVKKKIDKNQKDYYLREQVKVIQNELGEGQSAEEELDEYTEKTIVLEASDKVKERLNKEIKRLKKIPVGSSEGAIIRNYIEWLLDMPWSKKTEELSDLKHAEEILERDHYGLEKVKERVLEHLAVRQLCKTTDSPILCLVGPPGTGKTSIAKSIASALNRKYSRISLGGVRDEAEIRGHRKTYVGAMPGRIANALKYAGSANPLILLDEIDKMTSDMRGDPASALLEVLDGEQNSKFRDHYVEVPIDLSDVLFIATANSLRQVAKPLLDRLEIIEVTSYTENEKMHIAFEYLLPKQLAKHGLNEDQLNITKKAMAKAINEYTKESGVRNIERRIGEICRKAARVILSEEETCIKVTERNLKTYLGTAKYRHEKVADEPQIGIARGLAWTEVGGETLSIEVNVMEGSGKFDLTGQLGDIMKESATAAISYIRSQKEIALEKDFHKNQDIHIHIPEGAVPKDGPSAGITMATAMLSALTGIPVHNNVAMTGEITIRGRILPIGGLKEKLIAAKRAGIKKVLVPEPNRRNISEISSEVLDGLEIVYVNHMNQVLKEALVKVDG
ncbi:MAG: endopeptidase La, partial [Vallitaleaceae bacterium]|nr:endopeptidase La [Vallitaleaceae bacterium]